MTDIQTEQVRGALPAEQDEQGHRLVGITKLLAKTQEAGSIEVVRLDDLNIDHLYQRDLQQDRIQRMAERWDLAAAGTILVSRRENGSLWVVDGGHRAGAASLAGETEILAQVLEGLTPREEAELRLHANYRLADSPQQRFRAQVVAGFEESLRIVEIVEAHEGRVNASPNAATGINAVSTLEEIFRRDRTGVLLARTLEFLTDAFGSISGPTAVASLLKGVAFLLDRADPKMDRARMVEKLRIEGPMSIGRKARNNQQVSRGSLWLNYYRAFIEVYNERLSGAACLEARTQGWTRQGFTGQGHLSSE